MRHRFIGKPLNSEKCLNEEETVDSHVYSCLQLLVMRVHCTTVHLNCPSYEKYQMALMVNYCCSLRRMLERRATVLISVRAL